MLKAHNLNSGVTAYTPSARLQLLDNELTPEAPEFHNSGVGSDDPDSDSNEGPLLEDLLAAGYREDEFLNKILRLLHDGVQQLKDISLAECSEVNSQLHFCDRLYVPKSPTLPSCGCTSYALLMILLPQATLVSQRCTKYSTGTTIGCIW